MHGHAELLRTRRDAARRPRSSTTATDAARRRQQPGPRARPACCSACCCWRSSSPGWWPARWPARCASCATARSSVAQYGLPQAVARLRDPALSGAAVAGAGRQPDRRAAAGAQQGRVRAGDRGVQRGPPGSRPHRRRAGRAAVLRRDDVRQPGPPLADPGRPAHRSPRPARARRGGPGPAGRAVPARPPGHPDAPQRREPAGARRRRLHPRAARAGRPDRRAPRRAVRGGALHPHRVRHRRPRHRGRRARGQRPGPPRRRAVRQRHRVLAAGLAASWSRPAASATAPCSTSRTAASASRREQLHDLNERLAKPPHGRRGRLPDDGPGRGRPAGHPARRQGRAALRPPSAARSPTSRLPTSVLVPRALGGACRRRPAGVRRRSRCRRRPSPARRSPRRWRWRAARWRARPGDPDGRPAVRPDRRSTAARASARRRPARPRHAGLVRPDRRAGPPAVGANDGFNPRPPNGQRAEPLPQRRSTDPWTVEGEVTASGPPPTARRIPRQMPFDADQTRARRPPARRSPVRR